MPRECRPFPPGDPVATFRIISGHSTSNFCGYIHHSQHTQTDKYATLICLQTYLQRDVAIPTKARHLFLPCLFGTTQHPERWYVTYAAHQFTPFRDYLQQTSSNRNKNLLFLRLLSWIRELHQHQRTMPFLHPDMIFVANDTGEIKVLGPLTPDLNLVEESIPYWFPLYQQSNILDVELKTAYDYYPLIVMLVESEGNWHWDANRLKIYQFDAGPYHELCAHYLHRVCEDELWDEESVYGTWKDFLLQQLQLTLRIASKPVLLGTCQLQWAATGELLAFPGSIALPYATGNITISFPEKLHETAAGFYHLTKIEHGRAFAAKNHNTIVLNAKKIGDSNEFSLTANYKKYIKMYVKYAGDRKHDCEFIEVNGRKIHIANGKSVFSLPHDDSIIINIPENKGYYVKKCELDGRAHAMHTQKSITIGPPQRSQTIHIYFGRKKSGSVSKTLWIILILGILALTAAALAQRFLEGF